MTDFLVIFTLAGVERHERVTTTVATFARSEIESRYPGAIVTLILPGPRR